MSSVFVLCNLLQKWVCYACPKFWKFLPECTVKRATLRETARLLQNQDETVQTPWAFRQHENVNESRSKEDENESRNEEDHSVQGTQARAGSRGKGNQRNSEKETQEKGNEEGKEKITSKKKRLESRAQSIEWTASLRKKLTPQIILTTQRIPGWRLDSSSGRDVHVGSTSRSTPKIQRAKESQ